MTACKPFSFKFAVDNKIYTFLFSFMTLSLLTLNTGGCASPVKNASICTYVDNIAFNPDIVFPSRKSMTLLKNSSCWNIWSSYTPICAPSHTRGSGVAILYRSNLFNVVDSSIIFESHIFIS